MRHLVKGRKLKRTASHRKALLANLATSLLEHKKVTTTEAKAKELRPYVERLITKARVALMRERQGLLPDGQKIDIHNRRMVARVIRKKAVLQELFDAIAPVVESRNGGYTRIVKLGTRRGDAARLAVIELVDWSAPQDGTVSTKSKKKGAKKAQKPAKKTETKPVDSKQKEEKPAVVVEETNTIVEEIAQDKIVAPVVDEVTEIASKDSSTEQTAEFIAEPSTAEQPIEEVSSQPTEQPTEETKNKVSFDDTAEAEEQK
jgi:large subunit ribosomal protein L17